MDPEAEGQIPQAVTKIDWPKDIPDVFKQDPLLRTRMERLFRRKPDENTLALRLLQMMDDEKNRVNSSLPRVIPDELVEEILGYTNFITRMNAAFESRLSQANRQRHVQGILKWGTAMESQVPGFKSHDLEQSAQDQNLLDMDKTGVALADHIASQTLQQNGRDQGTRQAVQRYKKLRMFIETRNNIESPT